MLSNSVVSIGEIKKIILLRSKTCMLEFCEGNIVSQSNGMLRVFVDERKRVCVFEAESQNIEWLVGVFVILECMFRLHRQLPVSRFSIRKARRSNYIVEDKRSRGRYHRPCYSRLFTPPIPNLAREGRAIPHRHRSRAERGRRARGSVSNTSSLPKR
jgi:hypothetical protein